MKSLPEIRQSNARKPKPVLHLAFAEADEVVGGLGVWCGSEGKALSTTDKGRVTCAKCLRMMATRKPAPKKPAKLDPATLRWCARACARSARHWREGDATIATKELASDFRGMASRIERERGPSDHLRRSSQDDPRGAECCLFPCRMGEYQWWPVEPPAPPAQPEACWTSGTCTRGATRC